MPSPTGYWSNKRARFQLSISVCRYNSYNLTRCYGNTTPVCLIRARMVSTRGFAASRSTLGRLKMACSRARWLRIPLDAPRQGEGPLRHELLDVGAGEIG